MDGSSWFRVRAVITTDHAEPTAELRAELIADALWRSGPPAIEEQDGDGICTLVVGYPSQAAAEDAASAALDAGATSATVEPIDDDGLDGWRAHARPVRAGSFTILAPWLERPTPGHGGRPLVIDPGRSFGSGSHPTSRLVLAMLDELVTPSSTVLDVGCGSGILSIGAALLGAPAVHGIDVDPAAPEVTRANAVANGVADRVTASNEPLHAVASDGRSFDVVVANLLAPILVELADDLRSAVTPGGALVVSGLLVDRWEPAIEVLAVGGELVPSDPTVDDGWVAVHLDRPNR